MESEETKKFVSCDHCRSSPTRTRLAKSIYFRDKRKKANCWQRIAELLETTTEEVERRYKSIRTAFSRYLSKQRLKSGSGLSDIPNINQRFENLGWLVTHITSRNGTSNLELSLSVSQPRVSAEEPDTAEESLEKENTLSGQNSMTFNDSVSVDDELFEDQESELNHSEAEKAPTTGIRKRHKKDYDSAMSWVGAKVSNKAQLKKTDEQIQQAMTSH